MTPVWSVILAMLDAAVAMSGSLNGAKVMLMKAPFVPSRSLLLADVTPADFTGYAPSSAVVWGSSYIGPDGQGHVTGGNKLFTCSGASPVNDIYGWGLTDSAGAVLLAAALFGTPITIDTIGDGIDVLPDYIYGQ